MSNPLPSPRAVLNSLLSALINIPLDPPPPPSQAPPATRPRNLLKTEDDINPPKLNPLSRIPSSHRHLLITLHVLFPNLLLPALDLLDRGLVSRLALESSTKREDPGPENNTKAIEEEAPSSYLVQSAQTTTNNSRRRGRREERERTGKAYMVRLGAWNCTCAAFAFSEFASFGEEGGIGGEGQEGNGGDEMDVDIDGDVERGNEEGEVCFGGFSLEDDTEEGVPICKHILACVLGERWSSALGGYINEKRVGRAEMAGIMAEV